jgi:hypothetical protein
MQHRTLTRPQQTPQEVDPFGLEAFQTEVINEFKLVQQGFDRKSSEIAKLQDRLNSLETILTWVSTHRPEAIIDFNTTQDVIHRLDDTPREMMEKQA